jgi:hypothetical protein
MILKCLDDEDVTIRHRALDLVLHHNASVLLYPTLYAVAAGALTPPALTEAAIPRSAILCSSASSIHCSSAAQRFLHS